MLCRVLFNEVTMQVSHKRVQSTNDSSILSKYSMVKTGYFKDEFLKYFVTKDARRSPLIHRGYHIRMRCIDSMLRTFLTQENFLRKQVLSLGAGFDTSFFRLNAEGLLHNNCKFFEVDYPDVVKIKKQFIAKEPTLYNAIRNICHGDGLKVEGLNSDNYALVGCSLEDLQKLEQVLLQCGLDVTCPTLILSEVVMCYLSPSSSTSVIKWCSSLLHSAVFVTYEQVFPHDPFGMIMLNHFKQVGSPLRTINSFPSPESQVKRYTNQGWNLVRYQNMHSFQLSLDVKEQKLIQQLEIFDEFEEWDLKCLHYMVLCAFKGLCISLSERKSPLEHAGIISDVVHLKSVALQLLELESQDGLSRYGHTACLLPSSQIMIIGGFGEYQGKHMRLPGIDILHHVQERWQCLPLNTHDAVDLGPLMFHTATLLSDKSLMIFGGRTSPYKPSSTVTIISTDNSSGYTSCCELTTTGLAPCARWRHTATRFDDEGEKILVFGGRTTSQLALGDCYILDTSKKTWDQVDLEGDEAISRHSHTSCLWRENNIVLAGGFTERCTALSLVQVIDLKTKRLSTLDVTPPLLPRYSHTAHIINDAMIIIGGVNQIYTGSPSVVVVDLVSMTWTSYSLPVCPRQAPLMLHNHTSLVLDYNKILVIGGGGNCFSFGTHFNNEPFIIELSSLSL